MTYTTSLEISKDATRKSLIKLLTYYFGLRDKTGICSSGYRNFCSIQKCADKIIKKFNLKAYELKECRGKKCCQEDLKTKRKGVLNSKQISDITR
jgi:hypothetical protein